MENQTYSYLGKSLNIDRLVTEEVIAETETQYVNINL